MRGILYITFGAFIDTFQLLMSWALAGVSFVGSAAAPVVAVGTGAAIGCVAGGILGAIGGFFAGGIGAIPGGAGGCTVGGGLGAWVGSFFGTAAAAAINISGIILGYVVIFATSISFGTILVTLLMFDNMFYGRPVLYAYVGKGIPILNIFFPAWTGLAIRSVYKKRQEKKMETQNTGGDGQEEVSAQSAPRAPALPAQAGRGPTVGREIGAAVAVFLLFFGALPAHAQSLGVVPDPVQYIVAPEIPGPNELVEIQVQGVGDFLGNATITWQKDGKVVSQGVGNRTYSFTTGALGSYTAIHVTINSPTQGIFTHDFSFVPSAMQLLWEADTSVPLFYLGKPLYSAGSRIEVFAFPVIAAKGAQIPAGSLSFQWTLGGNAVPDASGLGRSTFTFSGSQLHASEDIEVDAYYGSARLARGELTISVSAPQIVLYDQDPLRGELLDQALPPSISLNAKEITVKAEPYYFSNSSLRDGSLAYAWTLDGNDTSGPNSAQGILTLRQTGSGVGNAALGVNLQNTDPAKFVQAADAAVQIIFGEQQGGILNFFGL